VEILVVAAGDEELGDVAYGALTYVRAARFDRLLGTKIISIVVHTPRLNALAALSHVAFTSLGMTALQTVSLTDGEGVPALDAESFCDIGMNLSASKIWSIFTSECDEGLLRRRREGMARDPMARRQFGSRQSLQTAQGNDRQLSLSAARAAHDR